MPSLYPRLPISPIPTFPPECPAQELEDAIRNRDLWQVDRLLHARYDPNALLADGNTPVHVAARTQNGAILQLILKKGGNPNAPNACGLTPVHIACVNDLADNLEILLEKSPLCPGDWRVTDGCGRNGLKIAQDSGARFVLERLEKLGYYSPARGRARQSAARSRERSDNHSDYFSGDADSFTRDGVSANIFEDYPHQESGRAFYGSAGRCRSGSGSRGRSVSARRRSVVPSSDSDLSDSSADVPVNRQTSRSVHRPKQNGGLKDISNAFRRLDLTPPKPFRVSSDSTSVAQSDHARSPPEPPANPFWAVPNLLHKDYAAIYANYAAMTDSEIRELVLQHGCQAAPFTSSEIRKLYVKKLVEYQRGNLDVFARQEKVSALDERFSSELERFAEFKFDMRSMLEKETKFLEAFDNGDGKRCLVYLLLDPQISLSIPHGKEMKEADRQLYFRIFLHSIFYIGQGGCLRPYSHLIEAKKEHDLKQKRSADKGSPKHCRIGSIWQSGHGVNIVHCFHDICKPEAESREALMIQAIGLKKLTNQRSGSAPGLGNYWNPHKKRVLGSYFLYKAFLNFLNDGGRQIFSHHV